MPIEPLAENSSILSRATKFGRATPTNNDSSESRPPELPERVPIRSRTGSGQQILSPDRPPSRNTPVTSSVRLPSASSTTERNVLKSDFEVDRSPLLNHTVQIDKSQIAKTRPRNLPTKRLSNPTSEEANPPTNDEAETKISSTAKLPSSDQIISKSVVNERNASTFCFSS